jgi:hypothetical protein
MRKTIVALLLVGMAAAPALSQDGPSQRDSWAASLSIEMGGGAWLGDFREHLDRDGAYLFTPSLDFSARFPISRSFGLEALIGSASVIHRYSKPIDGSFFYQQVGLYAGFPLGAGYAWLAGEAGFEHGTLVVTQYSSGIAGAAFGISAPINKRLSWTATIRFRRGFLQAVTIPSYYGTNTIDKPTSLTLVAGIAYSI